MREMNVDTDVNNYTVSDLLIILDLDEVNSDDITEKTEFYINKFNDENNREMASFFQDVQNTLLEYADGLEDENTDAPADTTHARKQSETWWKEQALTQDDPTQTIKITDRKQKIKVFNNPHVPMKQEMLGIVNSAPLPVVQDTLNPTLKNITHRFINLDSQYRQATTPNESSTDYTLDLSETLTNVLSLRLYSIQIPYTWYTIDKYYGNTCFWVTFVDSDGNTETTVSVTIESGNYTNTTFVSTINTAIKTSGITFTDPLFNPVTINSSNGKITMNFIGGKYTKDSITYTVDTRTVIVFFDYTQKIQCTNICAQPVAINQTLGWVMGYRLPYINVDARGNIALAVLDLYGPKYLILVIDDFNQNHLNSGLIGITEISTNIKMPFYYSPDLPHICLPPNPAGGNLLQVANSASSGILLNDKTQIQITYASTPQITPTAPRQLTQPQIYTINEIFKNNERTTNYRLKSPTATDTFAIIPVKHGGLNTGDSYIEFGGSLQDNRRTYFGPVNIERLRLKLLDDKGNVLNLNGGDWSMTLISENLYQY